MWINAKKEIKQKGRKRCSGVMWGKGEKREGGGSQRSWRPECHVFLV